MRFGILSDIHEANGALRAAIVSLTAASVDRFLVLGDLFETGRELRATIELLADVGAVGVWGNHDLGLAVDPEERTRQRYGNEILAYFATLRPRYEAGDCLMTHAQAWMDPTDLEQPWYLHGPPTTSELIARNFGAAGQRILLQGHYHRWLAATPEGVLPWGGEGPLRFKKGQRYLAVMHAVCDGWCAVYDADAAELWPLRISGFPPLAQACPGLLFSHGLS